MYLCKLLSCSGRHKICDLIDKFALLVKHTEKKRLIAKNEAKAFEKFSINK